jgi:hypothetical protein
VEHWNLMAAKRTSYDDDDSTKNLHVPSTKRNKHDDGNPEKQHPLFLYVFVLLLFCFSSNSCSFLIYLFDLT